MKTQKHKIFSMLICTGILFFTQCKTDELLKITKLQTGEITVISYNSAKADGSFIDLSGNVTSFGHCWKIGSSPTTSDSKYTVSGTAQKNVTFQSFLNNLSENSHYYVRAWAIDGGETIYGLDAEFATPEKPPIAISLPSATSHWGGGETYNITWTDEIAENVYIQLLNGTTPVMDIESGTGVPSSGSYQWSMPDNINDGTNYKIKISSVTNNEIYGLSEAFEIARPPKDFDNNVYKIVKIGNQWWTKENIKTTHFTSGTEIPNVSDNTAWSNLTHISIAYCYYNNSTSNGNIYGALYTWAASMNGSTNPGVQGACPTGWHVPTDAEYVTLETFLGMSVDLTNTTGWRGIEGKLLKEAGTSHWNSPNTGNDSLHFAALPGGFRAEDGSFGSINTNAYFWTSTLEGSYNSWHRGLRYDSDAIARSNYLRRYGRSVRCIRN